MEKAELEMLYRAYIECLNRRDLPALGQFVGEDAHHNGRPFGLPGYRSMLEGDYDSIPDLRFQIATLVCDPPVIAARLQFHCTPKGTFLGLPVNGRKVSFVENVFYEFRDGKIWQVWSVIDKMAIEAQFGI